MDAAVQYQIHWYLLSWPYLLFDIKLQKATLERNKLVRAHYLATIGDYYTRNQLIFLMKVLKMKEVYLDYMDILLEKHLLKRKWFLYVENDIPFCQHLQWKDLLPLIYLKGRVIKKIC